MQQLNETPFWIMLRYHTKPCILPLISDSDTHLYLFYIIVETMVLMQKPLNTLL